MATQTSDVYSRDQIDAIRQEYGHVSLGDHVRSVMDAATDDVKSVVEPIAEAVDGTVRSAGRDVLFFIAGAIFTLVVILVSRFI